MARALWLAGALAAALAGRYLLSHQILAFGGWILIGAGIGVVTALAGATLHDVLVASERRRY